MKNLYEELKELSMTGRLCYFFMCIEKYLITCYPKRDWTPVAKRCWQWTNDTWDIGCDIYSPVVPEFLLEFDNYEETNRRAFDGELSKSDYLALINLYNVWRDNIFVTNGQDNCHKNREKFRKKVHE